jgi:hypothetical protein
MEQVAHADIWKRLKRCKEGFFAASDEALAFINPQPDLTPAPGLNEQQFRLLEEAVGVLGKVIRPWDSAILRSTENFVRTRRWPSDTGNLVRLMERWLEDVEDKLLEVRRERRGLGERQSLRDCGGRKRRRWRGRWRREGYRMGGIEMEGGMLSFNF